MPTQQPPPQQAKEQHQCSKIVNDNNNEKRNKEESQQHQKQQQQQQQLQRKQQNLSNFNNNSNNNINNRAGCINNMEKTFRKSMDKSNTPLLSASTQLLKDATVAALMQRNKQCTPTASCSDASFSSASVADSIQDDMSDQCSLTQAGLEEYNIRASSYYDQPVLFHHQKQSSYAQSEGYHSYVSSSDSSSATPFLDRLRQEGEMLSRQSSHHWSQNDLSSISCASAAPSPTPTSLLLSTVSIANGNRNDGLLVDNDIGTTTTTATAANNNHQPHHQQHNISNSSNNNNCSANNINNNNNSSESTSSTETLKWHGSMSDVSEASHATGYSAVSESVSNSQLIVHSSRVLTPKRHHSESVLYLSNEQQLSPNRSLTKENTKQQQTQQQQIYSTYQEESFNLTRDNQLTTRTNVNHRHSPSYPPVHTTLTLQPYNQHHHHHYHQSEQQKQQSQQQQKQSCWEENTSSTELPKSSLIVNKLTTTTTTPTTVATSTVVGADTTSSSSSSLSLSLLPNELDQLNQSKQHDFQKSNISVTISSSEAMVTISPRTTGAVTTTKARSERETILTTNGANIMLIDDEGKSLSSSSLSSLSTASSHRSNHRLFPVSTYTEHSNTSQFVQHPKPQFSSGLQKPSVQINSASTNVGGSSGGGVGSAGGQTKDLSSQNQPQSQSNSWHSVAELINDFERSTEQQPQKYAFMDPNKTQRISNPALKAIQKNAVQSYFERQQQQQQHYSKEKLMQQRSFEQNQNQQFLPQPQQHQQLIRPHSFQALASTKEVDYQELQRSSLPNTYNAQHPHQQQFSTKQQQQKQILGSPSRMGLSSSFTQLSARSPQEADEDINRRFQQPASPEPPPPPPRSRSLMPVSLLRRSSSASDYAEFRDQYQSATQEKLQAQSIKNISNAEKSSFNDCGMPPPPPPRGRGSVIVPERRTSSASEYAAMRDKFLLQQAAARTHQQHHPHQYNRQNSAQRLPSQGISNYHAPPGSVSTEGWVPERPPKNPNLRIPSPDLPPPPTELDTSLSDEPLPPPPPEILHRQPYYDVSSTATGSTSVLTSAELAAQVASTNRRNSFAGSSARKIYYSHSSSHNLEAPSKIPPMIPKKPTNIEQLHPTRSTLLTSPQKQPFISKAQPQQQQSVLSQNQNRKRPHNPGAILNVPPIPENLTPMNLNRSKPASSPPQSMLQTKTAPPPPPPLKPRNTGGSTQNVMGVQMRCNSKASYLPRQSLEKLNNSDPDHGSYKLTLNSNEDLVNSTNLNKPVSGSYEILVAHNGKLPNNLPDVLPLGAKLQQPQPDSPTGNGKVSPLRYSFGSNSSMASSQLNTTMYPLQHRYSTPAMGTSVSSTYNNSNNNSNLQNPPNYIRSQSYDVHGDGKANNRTTAAKFMSQSTIDLKSPRTHTLDTTHEEDISPTTENPKHILSPAQSENNLSDKSRNSIKQPLSPTADLSNNEMHASTEGRLFRAELVSTTLPGSPALGSGSSLNKTVIRKDSLRENIEKITQLQSKLMSAHLSDNTFGLSGYGTKALPQNNNSSLEKVEQSLTEVEIKAQKTSESSKEITTNETTMHENVTDAALSSPTTPKQLPSEFTTLTQQNAVLTESFEKTEVISDLLPSPTETFDNENSLKLMQCSELILRVNPTMVEASSQTDDLTEDDTEILRTLIPQQLAKENYCTRTTLQPRQLHPIEVDCDKMCKELVTLLPTNDKLIDIITPPMIKTTSDYVSDLYNPNVPLRPTKHDVGTSTLMRMKLKDRCELKNTLTVELQYAELELTSLNNEVANDGCDMVKQKVNELIKHLKRKIRILENEQTTIEEESAINDELGSNLLKKFSEKVRPIEATKFRAYIDDIGHITSLLLSLSERLARAENSLLSIGENSAEKKTLESKRDRLFEQLEEAKRLKSDIDRRGSGLTTMLEKNLNADDFADFDYFINMKAKLIADSRDISDKIKSGEEQLNALSDTLVSSDC